MNQKQALAKLKKILGAKLAWRVNDRALSESQREEERELARQLRAEATALKEAMNARRAELLADPAYVDLKQRYLAADAKSNKALSRSMSKRITVGRISEMGFFHVVADGDNWADVVARVDK